jgi:hypothetical protein
MLLPALNKARTTALTASSISNLRQINLLVRAYVDDTSGWWPKPRGDDVVPQPNITATWRRNVWEHTYGKFQGTGFALGESQKVMSYAKTMWCPLMIQKYGQEQHEVGRGSYAFNKFFEVAYSGVFGGLKYRRDGDPQMVGNMEPIIMTGMVSGENPKFGTYDMIETSDYPYPTAADPCWKNVSYEYGGWGLGLFVDGHVEKISKQKATSQEFKDAINNINDLK